MIADRAEKIATPRRILPRATYTVRTAGRRGPALTSTHIAPPATTLLLNI